MHLGLAEGDDSHVLMDKPTEVIPCEMREARSVQGNSEVKIFETINWQADPKADLQAEGRVLAQLAMMLNCIRVLLNKSEYLA